MRATKQEEVREYLKRNIREALLLKSTEMSDRVLGESIRQEAGSLASYCCRHLTEEYRFLELSDIMEWKRTRGEAMTAKGAAVLEQETWKIRRAQFLDGLDLLCRIFDATLEIKNLERYLPEFDDGRPRVRGESAFKSRRLGEDEFKEAFMPRSVKRRWANPHYVGTDD